MRVKDLLIIVLSVLVAVVISIATLYIVVDLMELPIDLPLLEYEAPSTEIGMTARGDMAAWQQYRSYKSPKRYSSVQEILDDKEITIPVMSRQDVKELFPYLDMDSVDDYMSSSGDSSIGYERLFVDSTGSSSTGIKTIYGDNVSTLDIMDGIAIISIRKGSEEMKLAIVSRLEQLDFTLARASQYWRSASSYAVSAGGILAMNASGYSMDPGGSYVLIDGLVKWHGDIVRDPVDEQLAVCFDDNMKMSIGTSIDEAYNAIDATFHLIQRGRVVYNVDDQGDGGLEMRTAKTALGQTTDGLTLLLVSSGGTSGQDDGLLPSDLLEVMQRYNAYNASMLSCGQKVIMYWNGRTVLAENSSSKGLGVKLPNVIYVKPYVLLKKNSSSTEDVLVEDTVEEIVDDTSGLTEVP